MTTNNNQEDCSICYAPINDDVDVCVTICNHKFHTGCLLRCNNTSINHVCPLCRTNVIPSLSNSKTSGRILPGVYNMDDYLEQLKINNISIDSISPTTQIWLDECSESRELQKEMKETKRQREEQYKINLKKTDINKYKLFYGKNISNNSISPIQNSLNERVEYRQFQQKSEEKRMQREEQYKIDLKQTNINKFKLFYGK